MNNRKMFNKYMTVLGEVFDKKFSKVFVESYWTVLSCIEDEAAELAFKSALSRCRFFPRPAELLALAGFDPDGGRFIQLDSRASEQAAFVLDVISGRRAEKEISDPITEHLVRSRFSIWRLRNSMMEKDERWFVKDFLEAYKDCNLKLIECQTDLRLEGGLE